MSDDIPMHVFEIDEDIHRDWCIASNCEEALRIWHEEYGHESDVGKPTVRQLEDHELDEKFLAREFQFEKRVSFREELGRTTSARIFASTEV